MLIRASSRARGRGWRGAGVRAFREYGAIEIKKSPFPGQRLGKFNVSKLVSGGNQRTELESFGAEFFFYEFHVLESFLARRFGSAFFID